MTEEPKNNADDFASWVSNGQGSANGLYPGSVQPRLVVLPSYLPEEVEQPLHTGVHFQARAMVYPFSLCSYCEQGGSDS